MISYEDWVATGQYPTGEPLNPNDKNMPGYYENYVNVINEANASGNLAHKKEVERQHGIIDTTTATETEKKGYVEYVLGNEDLRENAEALGLTQPEMAEFGQKHYETFGVDQYIYDYDKMEVTDYGKNVEDRANYLEGAAKLTVTDPEAFKRDYDVSDEVFEGIIRDYGSADNWLYGGGDPSKMWTSRGLIADEFGGSPWDLENFNAAGWNMSPDNPYARAIRAGTIDVAEDVGQLLDTGNVDFLQDRYEDDYRANDFPEDWVDDAGDWQGPEDLGKYWEAISTAVRDPNTGEISSLIPSTDWTTYGTTAGGGGATGVGPGVASRVSTVPYTQPNPLDWSNIMPEVNYSTQFEALTGNKGRNWQPWATGQATPSGLVDYQVPGVQTSVGTSPNVTYTGGNPSLFSTDTSGSAFSSGSTTTDTSGTKWVMTPQGNWVKASSDYGQGLTGQGRLFYDQHYDSSGNYVGAEGLSPEEQGVNFAADAHEAMYPGSQAAANLAGYSLLGATSLNPAYTDYKDYQRQIMGLLPGQKFYSGDWIDAFDNMTPEDINIDTEMAGWTPNTPS